MKTIADQPRRELTDPKRVQMVNQEASEKLGPADSMTVRGERYPTTDSKKWHSRAPKQVSNKQTCAKHPICIKIADKPRQNKAQKELSSWKRAGGGPRTSKNEK